MRTLSILASLLATGSVLAFAGAAPASAQTYDQGPFGPIGDLVTAPVAAASAIADAPIAAATGAVGAPVVGAPVIQSNRTAAFVANVIPNINFLDDASRMALERSPNPSIRRFAHRIAVEQTIAGNSMTAWADTNPPVMTGRSAYVSDPITGLASLPLNVIVGVGNGVTGGNIVAASDGRALLRSQSQDLSRLSASNGPAFDILYRETERDALRQLITLYTDYEVNGDDPALRSFTQRELPKVKSELFELNRL